MPDLRIEYDGKVLHDGHVDELQWDDAPGKVTVVGKVSRPGGVGGAAGSGLSGLLGALAGASKRQTESIAEQHRAELAYERDNSAHPDMDE